VQGRDELFSRIFLHKSQSWAIVGGKKERGLRDDKEKQKRKFEDGEKSAVITERYKFPTIRSPGLCFYLD